MPTATPAKLRDGTWGVRVVGRASSGQTVRVQARSGKAWDTTISRVIWSGTDRNGAAVSLCSTGSSSSGGRGRDDDHEDCLSVVGGCGADCPYNFRRGRR